MTVLSAKQGAYPMMIVFYRINGAGQIRQVHRLEFLFMEMEIYLSHTSSTSWILSACRCGCLGLFLPRCLLLYFHFDIFFWTLFIYLILNWISFYSCFTKISLFLSFLLYLEWAKFTLIFTQGKEKRARCDTGRTKENEVVDANNCWEALGAAPVTC